MKGTVTLHRGIGAALSSLASYAGDAVALVVQGGPDDAGVRVLSMTAFGPSVWEPPARGAKAAAAIAVETAAKGNPVFAFAQDETFGRCLRAAADRAGVRVVASPGERDGDVETAIAAFRRRQLDVRPRAVVDGEEVTRSWSVVLLGNGEADVAHGDRLRLAVEPVGDGANALRWRRAEDGLDCGLHVLVRRPLDEREREVARTSRATVASFTYGRIPTGDAERTTLLLTLDIPCLLARSFRDGRLPKYNVLPAELAGEAA